jgi:hypothetical protein
MRTGSLQRLLEAARALPGERDPVAVRRPALAVVPTTAADSAAFGAALAARQRLSAEVAALLRDLADTARPALEAALLRAASAWDQADAARLVDDDVVARARVLTERWRALAAADASHTAAALEAVLAIDAALALLQLVEKRLATLIRLQTSAGGELMPGGRPFLDVSAALAEAAGAWA